MVVAANLVEVAALVGDTARATILAALMSGQALTASELAYIARVSRPTASEHLTKLVEARLIAVTKQGRYRYYRIASADIAASIEALANVAQAAAPQRPTPRPVRTVPVDMRYARTCYDHMAGELAVRVYERLVGGGLLTAQGDTLDATPAGAQRLAGWGIDVASQRGLRRRFACMCPDWSERRPHLGGALGAALLDAWSSHGWVERTERPRVLRVTPAGHRHFDDFLRGA